MVCCLVTHQQHNTALLRSSLVRADLKYLLSPGNRVIEQKSMVSSFYSKEMRHDLSSFVCCRAVSVFFKHFIDLRISGGRESEKDREAPTCRLLTCFFIFLLS